MVIIPKIVEPETGFTIPNNVEKASDHLYVVTLKHTETKKEYVFEDIVDDFPDRMTYLSLNLPASAGEVGGLSNIPFGEYEYECRPLNDHRPDSDVNIGLMRLVKSLETKEFTSDSEFKSYEDNS